MPGVICAALYLMVAVFFGAERVFHQTPAIQALLYATIGAITLFYFLGIPLVREARMRTVVGFAAIFAILGFITIPFDSTDVFFYIAQGWEQSHYNFNPYAQVLRDVPDGLSGVAVKHDAVLVCHFADFRERRNGADLVVGGHDRNEHRAFGDSAAHVLRINQSRLIDW